MSIIENLTIVDMWTGEADLLIHEIGGEELHALSPMSMGKVFRHDANGLVVSGGPLTIDHPGVPDPIVVRRFRRNLCLEQLQRILPKHFKKQV
jgi:hypothetical protein